MHENMMGGGGGNGFADGMLGAVWKFFCLVPRLLGLAVGGLCGLILKLGMAGRVILSALAAAGALIILAVIATGLIHSDHVVVKTAVGIVEIVAALAVGAWFWLFHYKVVRQIPYRQFVALATRCMMICFWGTVVLGIALAVGSDMKSGAVTGMSMGISLTAAIVYWLWKTKGYDGAAEEEIDFDSLHKSAESGDSQAMLMLASAFFDGVGVTQDKAKGLEWYKKAADSGNAVARYNLGVLYFDGDGVKQDRKKSLEWYRKAAENGHSLAQYCMYLAYAAPEAGSGINKDPGKAMEWLEKSAANGCPEAQEDLAE
jgi:hypothetical protein